MAAPRFTHGLVRDLVIRGMHDLPPLSDVVRKTLDATERDSTTAVEIEHLVEADAALAAKILRVVNSAYYGLSAEVVSLSQAVVVLGMQQIRNLVLSMSVLALLKTKTPAMQATQRNLWLHSFASAACAQAIVRANTFGPRDTEAVYAGGLLHDIGKLYLFSSLTDRYVRFCEGVATAREPDDVLERRIFGMGHDEIGGLLADQWHFPKILRDLIALHEGPFEPGTDPLLLAVHAADRLSAQMYAGGAQVAPMDPIAEAWLDTIPGIRGIVIAEMEARIAEASELFGVLL